METDNNKVALMTWFDNCNFGTALQLVALDYIIKRLNYKPEIINYVTTSGPVVLENNIFKYYKNKIKIYLKNRLYKRIENDTLKIKYNDFYRKHIIFTNKCNTLSELQDLNDKYSIFISGSDQIWSPLCFDSHFLLDYVSDCKTKIAYAPSFGVNEIIDNHIKEEIALLVSKFYRLSVREDIGAEILSQITKKNVEVVLDPTLLLDKNDWKNFFDSSVSDSNYLLAYFLGNSEKNWELTYKIASKLHLKVKVLPIFEVDLNREGCITRPIGPEEFVQYINNASYVCTDSFHGTAFAINFHKNFCVFERFKKNDSMNQNSRIYNILELLDLNNHLYKNNRYLEEIDYSQVDIKLDALRKSSCEYLENALRGVQARKEDNCTKNNILKREGLCCGCGACISACPVNAISVKCNDEGFLTVDIDDSKCISCGKCISVCPFYGKNVGNECKSAQLYSYKDKEKDILLKSSSGGFAYRISEIAMKKGYSVAGCIYDKDSHKARHILIEPQEREKLTRMSGSKYMQSDFSNIITLIKEKSDPTLIIGTPCQIAGARKALADRDNIIYIDLICHGVPSHLLYQKYQKFLCDKYKLKNEHLETIFRYKPKGWKKKYIYNTDSSNSICKNQSKDYYFRMFEKGFCYSPACYECRWRDNSVADIRIGDFWGDKFENDKTGVSMVLVMTQKGKEVIEAVKNCKEAVIEPQDISNYYNFQQTENNHKPVFYNELMKDLQNDNIDMPKIVNKYVKPFEKRNKISKAFSYFKKRMKKL